MSNFPRPAVGRVERSAGAEGRRRSKEAAPTLAPHLLSIERAREVPAPIALTIDRPGPYLLEILTTAQWKRLRPGQLPELFIQAGPDYYVRMRFDLSRPDLRPGG